MKRIGLVAFGLFVLIFGIEGFLSLTRQRNLYLDFRVEGRQPAPAMTPGPTPTPSPNGGNVGVGSIVMASDGALLIDLTWDYRIGPRFPVTEIRAEIVTSGGDSLASDVFTINCGAQSLSCEGKQGMALRYMQFTGTPPATTPTTKQAWPVGSYTLRVWRTYIGTAAQSIAERVIVVVN